MPEQGASPYYPPAWTQVPANKWDSFGEPAGIGEDPTYSPATGGFVGEEVDRRSPFVCLDPDGNTWEYAPGRQVWFRVLPDGSYVTARPGEEVVMHHEDNQKTPAHELRLAATQRRTADYTEFVNTDPIKRTWREAYHLYKANPNEKMLIAKLGKWSAIFFGINIFDEAIPILGQLDDPIGPLQLGSAAVFGAFTLWRVSKYREN